MAKRDDVSGEATEKPARAMTTPGATPAPTIDQVRELLFGEARRTTEQNFSALESRLDAFAGEMDRRLADIEKRMADLDNAAEDRRQSTVDMIGLAIADVGALIRSRAR